MSKNKQTNIRIDETTKRHAERIFDRLGLKPSDAIRMFYRQVVLQRGLPFSVKVPNATTRAAIEDVESGKNLTSYNDPQELFDDLES